MTTGTTPSQVLKDIAHRQRSHADCHDREAQEHDQEASAYRRRAAECRAAADTYEAAAKRLDEMEPRNIPLSTPQPIKKADW